MKKIFTILLCGILVLGLTACGSSEEENNIKIGKKSDLVISNDSGVTLSIKEGTLTKKGATFILKNDSDYTITYGDDYSFEVKKDGEWYEVEDELNFPAELYFFPAGLTEEFDIYFVLDFALPDEYLPSGTYRLIKDIGIGETGLENKIYLAAEFTI